MREGPSVDVLTASLTGRQFIADHHLLLAATLLWNFPAWPALVGYYYVGAEHSFGAFFVRRAVLSARSQLAYKLGEAIGFWGPSAHSFESPEFRTLNSLENPFSINQNEFPS